MDSILKIILDAAIGLGVGVGVAVAIVLYLFHHPDKFEHWVALFYRALFFAFSGFPILKRKIDRYAVAASIQDSVNGACETVNRQSPGTFPHAVRIDWVQAESKESFIKRGQVVVRLKHFEDQDKNIVDATLLYLKVGFLPRARHYLDTSLQKGCLYKAALEIFAQNRDSGAYRYFLENEVTPELLSNPDLKYDLEVLDSLDTVGYFTRIFLCEVRHIGEKLVGNIATPAIQQELREFSRFLQAIATKGRNEDVPLSFNGAKIKVALVLVAKRQVILFRGITPYVNRIMRLVRDGYDSIYIAGWGDEFAGQIEGIKGELSSLSVKLLRRYVYKINTQTKAVLLVCQSDRSYIAKQLLLQKEVEKVMRNIIPEVASGAVEIVSVSRVHGVGSKVAVRASAEGGNLASAITACIGVDSSRLSALRKQLNQEFIGIVGFSDDVKDYLINALVPLKASDVERIELDEGNLSAKIIVKTSEAETKALGKNNINVRLAMDLTGWAILILLPIDVQ